MLNLPSVQSTWAGACRIVFLVWLSVGAQHLHGATRSAAALDVFLANPDDAASRAALVQQGTNALAVIVQHVFLHVPDASTQARIDAAVAELHADDYSRREGAASELVVLGQVVRSAVQELANSDDPELSMRALQILSAIESAAYTKDSERIRALNLIHDLVLNDFAIDDLRATALSQEDEISSVVRFEHPEEREILAVLFASLLVKPERHDTLMRYAHTQGPVAGLAVRVMLSGLHHLMSDDLPLRWRRLGSPDCGDVVRHLVRTHNPEVARALVWGVNDSALLPELQSARGKNRMHEVPEIRFIYNRYLWHRTNGHLAKRNILAIFNDVTRGPEGLMHLWARLGKRFETTSGIPGSWKLTPATEALSNSLRMPSSEPVPGLQSLYVWRGPVPGGTAWYQGTMLEPLEGQAAPTPSASRQRTESDFYGVVHFEGLTAGRYRLHVQSGTASVARDVDLQFGVNTAFMPAPATHSDLVPLGIASMGMRPRKALRVEFDLPHVTQRVVQVTCETKDGGERAQQNVLMPGVFSLENMGKQRYRIRAESNWSGRRLRVEPSIVDMMLPLPVDVDITISMRFCLGRNIDAAVVIFRSNAIVTKATHVAFVTKGGDPFMPVELRADVAGDQSVAVMLPVGSWTVEWETPDGDAQINELLVEPGKDVQTFSFVD
jgi:plasmid stabilization system protein ParE